MSTSIYHIMKKRGFYETLNALAEFENYEVNQPQFFQKLEEMKSYYNAYLRVRQVMVEKDIIQFKLTLTEKGQQLFNKISEIKEILTS